MEKPKDNEALSPEEQIKDHDYDPKVNLKNVKEEQVMENIEIVKSILSNDATKLAEAKAAIKSLLDARAAKFRADSQKFVAKSLFETKE